MNISWEMILPLVVLQLALAVFALISCIKEERTNGPRLRSLYVSILSGRFCFLPSAESKGKPICCLLNHYANRTGIMKL